LDHKDEAKALKCPDIAQMALKLVCVHCAWRLHVLAAMLQTTLELNLTISDAVDFERCQ
jgi:hypothetical protein